MAKKSKPEKNASRGTTNVNLDEIEQLLDFMQKHGLQEFEYEREGVRIFLKKAGEQTSEPHRPAASVDPVVSAQSTPLVNSGSAGAPSPAQAPAEPGTVEDDLHIVKSPIVGTFYWAPSPDAEPFVTEGSTVKAGQVLCIIEAMKLMNEIEADVAGVVARIFVENGHPVEYGESLFGIRPGGRK